MFKTIMHNRCIHCNKKISEFNEERHIETIFDETIEEKRYCCKKCFKRFYEED